MHNHTTILLPNYILYSFYWWNNIITSTHSYIQSVIHPSINPDPSIHQPTDTSIHPSIHTSINISIHPTIHPYIHPPIYSANHQPLLDPNFQPAVESHRRQHSSVGYDACRPNASILKTGLASC